MIVAFVDRSTHAESHNTGVEVLLHLALGNKGAEVLLHAELLRLLEGDVVARPKRYAEELAGREEIQGLFSCKRAVASAVCRLLESPNQGSEVMFQPDALIEAAAFLFNINDIQLHHLGHRILCLLACKHQHRAAVLLVVFRVLRSSQGSEAVDDTILKAGLPMMHKACATQCIIVLIGSDVSLCQHFIDEGIVKDLIGNLTYAPNFELQRFSGEALATLYQTRPDVVERQLRHYLTAQMYEIFMESPESFHQSMSGNKWGLKLPHIANENNDKKSKTARRKDRPIDQDKNYEGEEGDGEEIGGSVVSGRSMFATWTVGDA
jgi:hypothetical protein